MRLLLQVSHSDFRSRPITESETIGFVVLASIRIVHISYAILM